MRSVGTFHFRDETYDVLRTAYPQKYGGRVAYVLWHSSSGEPEANLSVNIPEIPLEDGEFVVNHDLMATEPYRQMLEALLACGQFTDTGKRVNFGYCRDIPVWRYREATATNLH